MTATISLITDEKIATVRANYKLRILSGILYVSTIIKQYSVSNSGGSRRRDIFAVVRFQSSEKREHKTYSYTINPSVIWSGSGPTGIDVLDSYNPSSFSLVSLVEPLVTRA